MPATATPEKQSTPLRRTHEILTVGERYAAAPKTEPVERFDLQPRTAVDERLQFECVAASEEVATIISGRTGRPIDEILLADGARFPSSLPLQDSHMRFALRDTLGAAFNFRRDGSRWLATVELTKGVPDSEQAYEKVRQGHVRSVSIGYAVNNSVTIQPGQSQSIDGRTFTAATLPLRVVRLWYVHELSLVAIGADKTARVRQECHSSLNKKSTTGKSYFAQQGPRKSYFA